MNTRKIYVLDIQAGGGHKAASQSLLRALEELNYKNFQQIELESDAAEKIHTSVTNNWFLQKFYHIGHRLTSTKLALLLIKHLPINTAPQKVVNELQQELKHKLLTQEQLKDTIFISTHLLITNALLSLRKQLQLQYKVVVYVPDFDHSALHFPVMHGKHADGIIAQSPNFVKSIQRRYGVPGIAGGFIPANSFSYTSNNRETGFHIVVVGGSQWVHFFEPTLKKILRSNELNNYKVHLHIINGSNDKSQQKFASIDKYNQMQIHSYRYLAPKELASIYQKASVVIMVSIAPATLYELINASVAPIIVHRTNPGQELDTLKYALNNNLVTYLPKAQALIQELEKIRQKGTNKKTLRYLYAQEAYHAHQRLLQITTLFKRLGG